MAEAPEKNLALDIVRITEAAALASARWLGRGDKEAGDGAAVAVDPDVAELLAFSQEIARQLPGDFDITIAPVMDAWGFTREERHVPDPDTLADTLALVDWRALKSL